jgi:hypothetical protein
MEQELTLQQAKLGLLRVVEQLHSVAEIQAIRQAITDYYAQKVDDEMEQLWQSGAWNEQTIKDLECAHLRTPYQYAK